LIGRIIFLEGHPNLQTLDPLHIGQNTKEILDADLALEMSARALYQDAATHCHGVRDYVSRDLFEELMRQEEEHIDFLETQLDLFHELGPELHAQAYIGDGEKKIPPKVCRRVLASRRAQNRLGAVAHADPPRDTILHPLRDPRVYDAVALTRRQT